MAIDRGRSSGPPPLLVPALVMGMFCFLGVATGRRLSLGWWPTALVIGVAVTVVSGALFVWVNTAVERHRKPLKVYEAAAAVLASTLLIAALGTIIVLLVLFCGLATFAFDTRYGG